MSEEEIVKIIIVAIGFLFAVLEYIRTGSLSKGVKKIMTFLDKQKELSKPEGGKTFSEKVPDYKYNEETGLVDEVGVKNIQEQIDSSLNTSLDYFLQRFLDDDGEEPPVVDGNSELSAAYDAMLDASMLAEKYAEAHHMEGASLIDIMKAINDDYKSTISKQKGVKIDEKTDSSQDEQESKQA